MLIYQIPYPPSTLFPEEASFSWIIRLIVFVVLATIAGLWAVLDAHRQPGN